MRAGDRVKFRPTSKAWRSHGLNPNAQGVVVEIYRAAIRGDLKVDVRFGKDMNIERGIDIDELETIHDPPPAPSPPLKRP
jgi:hypothetical protein